MVGSTVYVGGLPYGTSERDLERFFSGFGRMDVFIKKGYGFVEFDDDRDADDAVYKLNGKKLLGGRVTVERARGTPRGRDQWSSRSDHRSHERFGPPTRTNYRLLVENLSSRVSWQDLKNYMRQAGEVTFADAHKQHRNEGVVEFASYSDLKNAIKKLDDTELNGRRIKLVEDKKRSSRRSDSYSRSRKRSPRRSRSRSRSRHSSRSKSKSRSPSPNKQNGKSRSRSNSRKKSVDRSRSNPRKRSVDRSRSRSRSLKRSKSRDASKRRSRSRSISKERSKSRSRSASLN